MFFIFKNLSKKRSFSGFLRRAGSIILLGLSGIGIVSAASVDDVQIMESHSGAIARSEPIKPIPLAVELDARKVELGQKLFLDKSLSHNNSIACSSCHSLAKGGTDNLTRSSGLNNAEGLINAPSVFNSGDNFKQFWDGRADTLEDQIDGPVQATNEMGSTWKEVISKLKAEPDYVISFKKIYADAIQPQNIKNAIAEFERSLITPNARFDKYLRGDESALTTGEKSGYRKFKSFGCISCHQGVSVGGNMFEVFGTMGDYFTQRGNLTKADLGRFNLTGQEVDRYVFKVPSLRNVALTAPYFHDGAAKTLENAIDVMAQYQLGRILSRKDTDEIAQFLKTLTGEYKGKLL